jgi:hypothetical protein
MNQARHARHARHAMQDAAILGCAGVTRFPHPWTTPMNILMSLLGLGTLSFCEDASVTFKVRNAVGHYTHECHDLITSGEERILSHVFFVEPEVGKMTGVTTPYFVETAHYDIAPTWT